jgi:hypothetical protein
MEPERRPDHFFRQMMRPIAAANVKQFMTGNGGLEP